MTFTIAYGWWIAPLAITVAAWGWCWSTSRPVGSGLGAVGASFGEGLRMASALIVTLVAWLIWALLT